MRIKSGRKSHVNAKRFVKSLAKRGIDDKLFIDAKRLENKYANKGKYG